MFDGFDGKDPCSYCKTLDARVYQYGLAIANVASLLDPRMIVVGGDIHEVMGMSVERLNKIIGDWFLRRPTSWDRFWEIKRS